MKEELKSEKKKFQQVYNENKELEKERYNYQLSAESLQVQLNESWLDCKHLEESNNYLRKTQKPKWLIEMPGSDFETLKAKLKMCDKFTIRIFLDYLTLDSFNLVKNSASALNKWNDTDVLQYMDWALSRNEWLKDFFQTIAKENFFDRLEGKEKNIKTEKKKQKEL